MSTNGPRARKCVFAGLAVFTGALACSAPGVDPSQDVTATEAPLYDLSTSHWDAFTMSSFQIPVCFNALGVGVPIPASVRQPVRAAIRSSWTQMAGIYFSGWGTCSASSKGIRITHATGTNDVLWLGQQDGVAEMRLDLASASLATSAMHEFGHALGFAHEHNRADNTTCKPCTVDANGDSPECWKDAAGNKIEECIDGFCRQGPNGNTTWGTPYDPLSIMNYCGPNKIGPSPYDVVGARLAYPNFRPLKLMDERNYCMGVYGYDSHTAGAGVEVYTCGPEPGDAKLDERWSLRPTTWSYFRVVNMASGLCLGVSGVDAHGEGAPLEVYGCEPDPNGPWGNDPKVDEEWSWFSLGGGFALRNKLSNLYVGGTNNGPSGLFMTSDRAKIKIFKRLDLPVTYGETTFKLANAASFLCLGLTGIDTRRAGVPELYDCAPLGSDAKQDEEWISTPTTDGYFTLKNANGGFCLSVRGLDYHTRGAAVVQGSCTDLDSQWRWLPGTNANGYTQQLQNRYSGLCLGVPYNDNHSAGTGLEVWDCPPVPGDPRNDENWIAY